MFFSANRNNPHGALPRSLRRKEHRAGWGRSTKRNKQLLAVVGVLLLYGCSTERDPVRALQGRITHIQKYHEGKDYRLGEISYDVEKTSSLVSPYTGTIKFTLFDANRPVFKKKLLLAYQDKRWVLKSTEVLFWYDKDGEWTAVVPAAAPVIQGYNEEFGVDDGK